MQSTGDRKANPSAWRRPGALEGDGRTASLARFSRIRGVVRGLRVDEVELSSPRVTRDLEGLRIVFASDVHAGRFLSQRRVGLIIDSINALEPDLLVLGGDYVGGRANGAAAFYPEAARLEARLGKVAVLGNHDVWEGAAAAREGLSAAGILLLENSTETFRVKDSALTVVGLEDSYTGHPSVSTALAGPQGGAPQGFPLLVAHHPDALTKALAERPDVFDLALAGHTHGGQVILFGSWALHVPPRFRQYYRSGWRVESGVPVLVSHGVGTVGIPLRMGAAPELHAITLRSL
ncbi:MAG TPA: metallophosphoesterase [Coriobacteriia bacterium]|nr:metallophosphoesterase [Coriobacteriia bacterium]